MVNEEIGGGDFLSDANFIEEREKDVEVKSVSRLTRKRKKKLGKSRKKREKIRQSSATSTGATAAEDEEDDESSDLPAVVSSTSGTESIAKSNLKDMKFTKTNANRSSNFAKIVKSLNATPFVFQKRLSRIDWRKIHTLDIDRVIREVDLDALESVLDTITFADIQGEDTRNFSEANFVKVFRLAQLMVEYLLHVQELLASHKETLMATGSELQRQVEKHRQRQVKFMSDLSGLRHNLKQAKKTIRTYEVMLRVQNKFQHREQKLKEQSQAQQDQQSVGAQTVRAETAAALQAEIKLLQTMSQADLQRAQAVAQLQISTLEATLRETNAKLLEVQSQLQAQV